MATETLLKIRSTGASFRRAGLSFTREPRTLKAADLTESQIAQLKAEPNLVVTESEQEVLEPQQEVLEPQQDKSPINDPVEPSTPAKPAKAAAKKGGDL